MEPPLPPPAEQLPHFYGAPVRGPPPPPPPPPLAAGSSSSVCGNRGVFPRRGKYVAEIWDGSTASPLATPLPSSKLKPKKPFINGLFTFSITV